ncbi:MAG: hypothetical protein RLZZ381_3129 [Cyanobacteriota bacterium]|jgi:WD40 repeat protein
MILNQLDCLLLENYGSKNQMFANINSDREIKLWEVNRGQTIGTLLGHNNIVKCLFIDS